jgi:hypothetical protein
LLAAEEMTPAVIRNYADLIAALRARKEALDISLATIEAVGGLTLGHAGKLLSPKPSKGLGEISLALVLQTLGVKLVLVEDPQAAAKLRPRLTETAAPPAAPVDPDWAAAASP